jgi:ribose transport system ATP-binding protein
MPDNELLRLTGISKQFGGVRALDAVDFDVRRGEVHALIGENGAGKSTLMNVLAGRFADYAGQVTFAGRAVRLIDPRQALRLGIHVVYQELSVLPNLTVAENIMLGDEPRGCLPGTVDRVALRSRATETLARLQFDLPLDAELERLSAAQQCLVEIARAVHTKAVLLVFDEPTAALGPAEVQKLFAVIADLKRRGMGIVYISHRLAELPQVADRVTVLRDGKVVGTRAVAECRPSELARMMLGREIDDIFPERRRRENDDAVAPPVLETRSLARAGVLADVSFVVRAGEIVGLAGLVGSGRTEIARAIVGADRAGGECLLAGEALPRRRRPEDCRRRGLCLVPESRKRDGNFTGRPVAENINAGRLERLSGFLGFLSPRRTRDSAMEMIQRLAVQPALPRREIEKLSGGNQQKVIIGRVLGATPRVIIFDEPTQGIDIAAKAQVYRLIVELAEQGCGIVLISSEFVELTELADRILIVRGGRVVSEWPGGGSSAGGGGTADEDALFAACVGSTSA